MYTTGQLAKKCNVSIRTIQYYDRRGLLHAKRTENGLRHYNDQDLKQLQEILIYKQLGFSLKNIQQIINGTDNNTLKSLIVNQRRKIKQEIKDASEQLASLSQLETLLWGLLGLLITVILVWYSTINYYHHTCYICPHCSHQFRVSLSKWLFAHHTPNTRYLTCDNCHQKKLLY